MHYNSVAIKTDFPTIKYEEAEKLIHLAQKGCQESREKIINGNIKLVLNLIHRFKGNKEANEDLFQIGIVGLIKAIDNFDLDRGCRFSTYAVPMILGEIKRYLRDNTPIKISRSIQENKRKIRDFREKFMLRHQREPLLNEIIHALDIEEEDAVLAIGAMDEMLSLSKTVNEGAEDKEQTLEEKLMDKNNFIDNWIDKEYLIQGFKKLDDKERMILNMRYYADKTQSEIGKELGMSQAHVSRIEKNALSKLRKVI